MTRKIINIDATLVEKYSEEEILVLCGGRFALAVFSINLYCPVDNQKNCGCNQCSGGGGGGFSGGGGGGGVR